MSLTGCLQWYHALLTYRQMNEFDQYFSVSSNENFTVHFKDPKLTSSDFVALAKLHPTSETVQSDGRILWHYLFRKVDKHNNLITPEISFYCDLLFGPDHKVNDWIFSKMFLQIAPAEFLEASFRSLGGAEINEGKKQLKAKVELAQKIASDLPKKSVVVKELGEPNEITDEDEFEVYTYLFKLEAKEIEEGYEDRAISEVKLRFDKQTHELVKMSGRFAGLKISINYRDYQEEKNASE